MRSSRLSFLWLRAPLLIAAFAGVGLFGIHLLPAAAPPPPDRVEDAVANLDLTPEQQRKVSAAVDDLHLKQRKLHEEFVNELSKILTADQLEKFKESDDLRPPPPPNARDDRGNGSDPSDEPAAMLKDAPNGTVLFTGGHDTDPRDHGRPVVLVAAGLGVPADVFRTAFSGVTPASGGQQPQPDQVRRNKQALLKVLEPLGVTNDRLDTVSNYYRYSRGKGEMWKTKPAAAIAIITNGKVTGFKVTDAGAGYSSPPKISVIGYDDVRCTVELSFGTDLVTNGSIKSITVETDLTH